MCCGECWHILSKRLEAEVQGAEVVKEGQDEGGGVVQGGGGSSQKLLACVANSPSCGLGCVCVSKRAELIHKQQAGT